MEILFVSNISFWLFVDSSVELIKWQPWQRGLENPGCLLFSITVFICVHVWVMFLFSHRRGNNGQILDFRCLKNYMDLHHKKWLSFKGATTPLVMIIILRHWGGPYASLHDDNKMTVYVCNTLHTIYYNDIWWSTIQ